VEAEQVGYVQRSVAPDATPMFIPVPVKVENEGQRVHVVIRMAPILVGVVACVPGQPVPAGYAEQFLTVSWDPPAGTEILQAHAATMRENQARVRSQMATKFPAGASKVCIVAATERCADRNSVVGEVAVRVADHPWVSETVAFRPLHTWSAESCTIVEVGGLLPPCQVIVRSKYHPYLSSISGIGRFDPLVEGDGAFQFMVPAGEYLVGPGRALCVLGDYSQRITVDGSIVPEVVPNWRLGTLDITSEVPSDSVLFITVSGVSGLMRIRAEDLPSTVALASGTYRLQVIDHDLSVVSETQIEMVDAGHEVFVFR